MILAKRYFFGFSLWALFFLQPMLLASEVEFLSGQQKPFFGRERLLAMEAPEKHFDTIQMDKAYVKAMPKKSMPEKTVSVKAMVSKAVRRNIVVSVRPYALILQSLLQEGDEISVLVDSGMTAHNFQLRPSHLKKIAAADLVIWGGEQAEPFLAKALAQHTQQLNIMAISNLNLIVGKEQLKNYHNDESTYHVHENNKNQITAHHKVDTHLWFSQANVKEIASAMTNALAYPDSVQRQFEKKLKAVKINKTLDDNQTVLWVYHDAYAYLEQSLGIKNQFVIKKSYNSQPSLAHWKVLTDLLYRYKKNKQSLCIVITPDYVHSSEAKKLNKLLLKTKMKNQTRLIDIDPLASNDDYQDHFSFLKNSNQQLIQCLQSIN